MKSKDWRQAKEIFNRAIEQPLAEREKFISEACDGNENLRREVEELLSSFDDSESFLENPVIGQVAETIFKIEKKLSIGQTIKHYKILGFLGAGGMGEVYSAQDTLLGRRVALKTLLPESQTDPERVNRFLQEARAASALNHPNILTVYEIGEAEGMRFIAAEFIEGETLRERMRREHLAIDECLDTAWQTAAALATAHRNGIVHRDIKPENIMLRREDGLVKVLDFGLAKLTEQSAESTDAEAETRAFVKTNPGMVMGTVSYMSPEQARGKDTDARSDIFSFGVVLYEMATRQIPFQGETMSDTIAAILKTEPTLPSNSNPEIPAEFERIILKTLAKNPDERYQTAKDLLVDLRRLKMQTEVQAEIERTQSPHATNEANNVTQILEPQMTIPDVKDTAVKIKSRKFAVIAAIVILLLAAAGFGYWYFENRAADSKQINSIAVLPFVNAGNDPNAEYLSDGIAESLMNSLSQLPNLKVASRNAVFRYKGKEQDAQTIGKELNIRAILTGDVKKIGDQIVINVSLDDTDGRHIWGDQYERKFADIFAVQRDIAQEVSSNLRLKLTNADEQKLKKNYTDNVQAYQLYLKGRYFSRQFTLEGFHNAVEAYNQAIALDPNYALAYSGLCDAYFYASTLHLPPREALPKAAEYAHKALALDDSIAETHYSTAIVKANYERDYAGAEREFQRAIEINPNFSLTYFDYGWFLSWRGEFDRAIPLLERAVQLDPSEGNYVLLVAASKIMARRYDEGLADLQEAQKLDDKDWFLYYWYGVAYDQKGLYDEAIESFQTSAKLDDSPTIRGALAHTLGRAGRKAEAQKIIDELIESSKTKYVAPYAIVMGYCGLGDKDKAFEWLKKADEARDEWFLAIKTDPMIDPLRDDPRFQDSLKSVELPKK